MPKISKSKPKTVGLVISALKKLMKNTGWSPRNIIKFIRIEYKMNDRYIGRKISRALKRGVRMGLFHTENGRYRLSEQANVSRRVSYRNVHAARQRKRNCVCIIRRHTPEFHD